jgi:hypothetical protein
VPRTVPLLYGTAVALLVAAGVLLSVRTATTTPVTNRVPDGCETVPRAVVEELFPGTPVEADDRVGEDGVPYGRWVDPDGTLLVELRCARVAFADVLDQQRLLEQADEGGRLERVDVDPPAVLLEVSEGSLVRQLHEGERLQRTWFVRGGLDAEGAAALIEATGPPAG